MKAVNATLSDYLNTERNIESADLYQLRLKNGVSYYVTSCDKDVVWAGHIWSHRLLILKREQINLKGAPAVDTLNITVHCDENDLLEGEPFMSACHNGVLDQAYLALYKAYFRDGECIGAYEVFEGKVEITSAGGITVKLAVKSIIQGLSQQVPVRIFAPQSAYASNEQGAVTSSSTDTATALIPLKPSSRVLISL